MQGYFVLALAVFLNASANILIKVGMRRIPENTKSPGVLLAALSQPAFWGGICLFGLALVAYSLVLSRLNLSVAYPIMVSLGLVIVVLVSFFLLKEPIAAIQVLGFILIVAGVWMVAR
ncbi:small multidrug resistance protein [bacterium]|nr:small multidrug resistance protein [bacterium]